MQIVLRLSELEETPTSKEESISKISAGAKDSCYLVWNGILHVTIICQDGGFLCEFYPKSALESFFTHFFHSKPWYILY